MAMTNAAAIERTDPTVTAVASNVRAEIARAGMTDGEFARDFGMTPMSMSRRLSAQTPFTTSEVARIAEYFGIAVGDLFRRTDWKPRAGNGARRRNLYLLVNDADRSPTDLKHPGIGTITSMDAWRERAS